MKPQPTHGKQNTAQKRIEPDHLGSSSWITTATGNANQRLAYLPYGEQFIDERKADDSRDIRFKFTAKERDTGTGFDYFGARYYSSGLSVWLSVDALAGKYPTLSPYMYTAGNPVNMIDPDGNYIHIVGTEASIAFTFMLKSFDGINDKNIFKAFGIVSDKNHIYRAIPMSKKQFKNNYKNVTGIKLRGKKLRAAYKIQKALSSTDEVEIEIFSGKKAYSSYELGKDGTEMVKELNNYISRHNIHPSLVRLRKVCENKATVKEINRLFDIAIYTKKGRNWKIVPFENNIMNKGAENSGHDYSRKGTILVNGNKSIVEQSEAILNAVKKIKFK